MYLKKLISIADFYNLSEKIGKDLLLLFISQMNDNIKPHINLLKKVQSII